MEAKKAGSGEDSGDSQVSVRRKKREDWKENRETDPYPTIETYRPEHLARELHDQYDSLSKEELEADPVTEISVSGRALLHRSFGKSTFVTLRDRTGRIQLFGQKSKLPENAYAVLKSLDLGDIVYGKGRLFKTKTGELTVDLEDFRLLTKSIRPLPEKFHGLQDVEQRYRQRYVDLICNDESKKIFETRSRIVSYIRQFFLDRDYLEVETPMLHSLVSGAAAKPFQTHHNTLKMDLFLRIAPELFLKRLVVGGFDRVFEMNRCFRNEGISIKHNPEFTMLEFYEAYATYEDLMRLTENLLEGLVKEVCDSTDIEYQGERISLKAPFKRLTVQEALKEGGFKVDDSNALKEALKSRKIEFSEGLSLAELQWLCFEEFIEEKLVQPTFIHKLPIEVSPLARRSAEDPSVAERFELFVAGREIANGFNELNDPEDQAARFKDQLDRKARGDEETTDYDEDYIQALEYGLPPTAGEGIGIDRLTMLLTNAASIRDVILFPQLRPSSKESS